MILPNEKLNYRHQIDVDDGVFGQLGTHQVEIFVVEHIVSLKITLELVDVIGYIQV